MSLRRCIIVLSLFTWFACAKGRMVDCERYPYHIQCRGAQTRKRFVNLEDNKLDEDRYHLKQKLNAKYNIPEIFSRVQQRLDNDKFLDAFLSAFVEKFKNNSKRMNAKNKKKVRKTQQQQLLSQLDPMYNDY